MIKIALLSGHTGKDDGAMGSSGTKEAGLTFRYSKAMHEMIDLLGMESIIVIGPFKQRFDKIREYNPTAILSIHFNASNDKSVSGSEVWIRNDAVLNTSRRLAEKIIFKSTKFTQIDEVYEVKSRGVKIAGIDMKKDWRIFRNENIPHKTPLILYEVGFITNPREEYNLLLPTTRYRIAHAVAESLLEVL